MNHSLWVILLDRSGSMEEGFSAKEEEFQGRVEPTIHRVKLDAAKEAVLREIEGLDPNCDIAIFAFDDRTELLFRGSPTDRSAFEPIVRAVTPRGQTNIAEALDASLSLAADYRRMDSLVITDGLSNVGDPLAAAQRCRDKGVSISVVLIDPTEEGQRIARSIALGGRVYAVASAAELDVQVGDAGIRQQLRFERDERGRLERDFLAKLSGVQEDLTSQMHRRFGTLEEQVGSFQGQLQRGMGRLSQFIEANSSQYAGLSAELHTLLAAVSLGVTPSEFPMSRYLPMRVYLKDSSREGLGSLTRSTQRFANALHFEVADDFPVEEGSIFKRWFVRSRDALSSDEVQERLRKLERAAELQLLDKPQAAVDKDLAAAASELIRAIEHEREAAIQIGSLLILKIANGRNSRVLVRSLSVKQIIALERQPESLKDPRTVLNLLGLGEPEEAKAISKRVRPKHNQPPEIRIAANPGIEDDSD